MPLLPLVPVQYSYTSTPLITCTVQLYLYSPQCLYSTAIPLLPLWAVRPVHSLSACTIQLYLYPPQYLYSTDIPLLPPVPVQYSYTSTPPMDRTACKEPQGLYSTAIPLLPSVPVQYSYTSTPLSACTVQLYLYSRYGPYGLYTASVPVERCILPLFYSLQCPQMPIKSSHFDFVRLTSKFVLSLSLYLFRNLIFCAHYNFLYALIT